MTFRSFLLGIAAVAYAAGAQAQTIWTGAGTNGNWTNASNWIGQAVPVNNGTAEVFFGPAANGNVVFNTSQSLSALLFYSSTGGPAYTLSSSGGSTLTLNNGLWVANDSFSSFDSGPVTFDSSLNINLGQDQLWLAEGNLRVEGVVSGAGRVLTLDGYASIDLLGNNTYSGGTIIAGYNDGEHDGEVLVGVGNNNAFGTGKITFDTDSDAGLYTLNGNVTVSNNIDFKGNSLSFYGDNGSLTLAGNVNLFSDFYLAPSGTKALTISGNIGETGGSRKVVVSNNGVVVLNGFNTYTGGTDVQYGILIFGSTGAIPATGLIKASQFEGYVGLASPPATASNLQSLYLDKFNKAGTYGTVGFDSDPASSTPNIFSGNIDLTGFAGANGSSARLGSATTTGNGSKPGAVLTGTITPQVNPLTATNNIYRFGGGGGMLEVASNLVDGGSFSRSLDVSSLYFNPLTLVLTGNNSFSGGTTADNSAVIFGSASALPTSGRLNAMAGGYIGLRLNSDVVPTDNTTVYNFLNKFSSSTTGIIGFDSADFSTLRTIGSTIDLTAPDSFGQVYLGTTTNLAITGNIILAGSDYAFTGYKGGQLAILSNLANQGANTRVFIGDQNNAGASGSPDGSHMSSVTLSGNNSYTGGTDFFSGRLVVGGTGVTTSLGTGTLRISGGVDPYGLYMKRLEVVNAGTVIPNAILLNDDLALGGANNFTLSGGITGYGAIYKTDGNTVTISQDSSHQYGTYITGGALNFSTDFGAGYGPLYLVGASSPTANFASSNPHVYSLVGDTSSRVNLADNSVLHVVDYTEIPSDFRGVISGTNAGVDIQSGIVRFSGANTYTGGTLITDGAVLVASNNSALGSGPVTVTYSEGSGTLLVDRGVTITNAITLDHASLGGLGTFNPSVAPIVANGSYIRPGGPDSFNRVGRLSFGSAGVVFASGGTLEVNLQDLNAGAGIGWDTLSLAGGLTITSNSGSPFSIRVVSLDPSGNFGYLAGITNSSSFSLVIATAAGGFPVGFDPSQFSFDFNSFYNTEVGVNTSNFSLAVVGNDLLLDFNFVPVPEPSSWALMGAGLIALGWRLRRRGV